MFSSLSARLLVLTVLFVALVDTVIVVSSVATFRRDWLDERLWDAQIASLAVAAAPDGRLRPEVLREALTTAMVDLEELAAEIADGGDAYAPGIRDVARRMVEDLDSRVQTLEAIVART